MNRTKAGLVPKACITNDISWTLGMSLICIILKTRKRTQLYGIYRNTPTYTISNGYKTQKNCELDDVLFFGIGTKCYLVPISSICSMNCFSSSRVLLTVTTNLFSL